MTYKIINLDQLSDNDKNYLFWLYYANWSMFPVHYNDINRALLDLFIYYFSKFTPSYYSFADNNLEATMNNFIYEITYDLASKGLNHTDIDIFIDFVTQFMINKSFDNIINDAIIDIIKKVFNDLPIDELINDMNNYITTNDKQSNDFIKSNNDIFIEKLYDSLDNAFYYANDAQRLLIEEYIVSLKNNINNTNNTNKRLVVIQSDNQFEFEFGFNSDHKWASFIKLNNDVVINNSYNNNELLQPIMTNIRGKINIYYFDHLINNENINKNHLIIFTNIFRLVY